MPLARAEAFELLKLDPANRQAHSLLCVVAAAYDYDWKEADRRYRLATADVDWSGFPFNSPLYLLPLGRLPEAINELRKALEQDPLHVLYRVILAYVLHVAGELELAFEEAHKALEMDDAQWSSYWVLAWIHAANGNSTDALNAAEHAVPPGAVARPRDRAAGGCARPIRKPPAGGGASCNALGAAPRSPGVPVGLAVYHLVCLEFDAAADWLEVAIEERETLAALYIRNASLRSQPPWSQAGENDEPACLNPSPHARCAARPPAA